MSNNLDLLENPTSRLRYDIPPWIYRIHTPRYTIYTPRYIALETYIAETFLIFLRDLPPRLHCDTPPWIYRIYTPRYTIYTPRYIAINTCIVETFFSRICLCGNTMMTHHGYTPSMPLDPLSLDL